MTVDTLGERIKAWRLRRGMSQQDLADRMSRSKSWIQKLEGSERHSDPRLSVLREVSEALGVPLSILIRNDQEPDRSAGRNLEQIEESIACAPLSTPEDSDVTPIRKQLRWSHHAYANAQYVQLADALPGLIRDVHRTSGASALKSEVYRLVTYTAFKHGAIHLAGRAADRSLESATDRHSQLLAVEAYALAFSRIPESAAAAATLVTTVSEQWRDLDSSSVYGAALLQGAVAAAAAADGDRALSLLARADATAQRLPRDDTAGTGFCTANVGLHYMDVYSRLGRYGKSRDLAQRLLDSPALGELSRERQAHFRLDLALLVANEQPAAACSHLIEVSRIAPAQLLHPDAQALMRTLMNGGSVPADFERLCRNLLGSLT
ncbi:Transcriptional regulator, XRE family OS=Tsukamurella paurometabola (strain ATCC 8368 / DSM/ CCUG 35730 / CIP 100753 / JCM 10117 / KCTC 9821 / NBRC 16120/ NCIMB 702349 / NCTC 13040) OX=521096 GN=Tpau_0039 PE=4 SV=1 [Tsukamurella paurometabola]|uniref:Transcriptional regulator, XRE family n=1 Tax=Tsukamurella paurometabola (strain ATCC 8368 / DSM 20162 / CCUG 35730 / CIP 100753 / JCM 10117 / KCTC 9821 / NBRC 16120 / NCIMB 702349 / NCTC 13040) TaxID=521096 RepID=D5UPS5_TSUPD|nr:helix-turn-helix transcriptional regulator [Tsukamurella paurometabola]ADG76693.1 transcriptional regulator, XRE family [Tsukamurella paurometabola DSM 20162]SUP41246.1 anaerobic benzoate catabolism transcriptional regulator [Tsukamurella paurometabola]